jgi:FkbM family methyltransferase
MNENLVFDLGFYNGDTSLPYLKEGYTVIGVDCNPNLGMIGDAFEYIINGQLILEKKCISDTDNDIVDFYIQPNKMVFSSVNKDIAGRVDGSICCQVETMTLASLIKKYGTPIYCKIDIEGNDILALKSLFDVEEKPKFISCETECIGSEHYLSIDGLENINTLHELGYNKFFLVEQNIFNNFRLRIDCHYEWKTYDEVIMELKQARSKHDFTLPYSFWWDVYATF